MPLMRLAGLHRHPVKSMLGERATALALEIGGVAGDRALAVIDTDTGRVATAKHPRLWRRLLRFSAGVVGDRVVITGPDGRRVDAEDPDVHGWLSRELGRDVRLSSRRPDGATVERPDPEDVLAEGVAADVPVATLEIAQGTTGATFVDHSPVHLITTATLARTGAEVVRYRPNLVLDSSEAAFVEDGWAGREIAVGDDVLLRVTLPTPRCAVPTLEHGDLPRAPHAVRTLLDDHRVEVPGFGVLPCAGAYAEVVRTGVVHAGDPVSVG